MWIWSLEAFGKGQHVRIFCEVSEPAMAGNGEAMTHSIPLAFPVLHCLFHFLLLIWSGGFAGPPVTDLCFSNSTQLRWDSIIILFRSPNLQHYR